MITDTLYEVINVEGLKIMSKKITCRPIEQISYDFNLINLSTINERFVVGGADDVTILAINLFAYLVM